MEAVFPILLALGGLVGLAMGWGALTPRLGCGALIAAPFILLGILWLEPVITGERAQSTAALALPFGSLWVGCAAAVGVTLGGFGRWLKDR